MGGDTVDQEIKTKFLATMNEIEKYLENKNLLATPDQEKPSSKVQPTKGEGVAENHSSSWASNLHGRLAAIIVCDQFARCIFRDSKDAFKFDQIAQKLSREMVTEKKNQHLLVNYRSFEILYLLSPLMHSEDIKDVQIYCESLKKVH